MNCPVCSAPLQSFIFNAIELNTCKENHCGVWFDHGELSAVELSDNHDNIDKAFVGEYTPKPLSESLSEGTRCCPRDGSPLKKYHWNLGSGIVLDQCTQDKGVWLDSGELEGYSAYIKHFKAEKPELSHERQAQLLQIETDVREKYDKALVPWDVSIFDDMLRGMVHLLSGNH